MPTLSDKLKSMGVKVGAQDLPPPRVRSNPNAIEQVLLGQTLHTPQGETFLIDTSYPAEYRQGRHSLQINSPLQALAQWAGESRICDIDPQCFAFLDTETTGLSGGTGTYAFLIGVGRLEGDAFHLAQFFMRDPIEEPAQLAALEEFLAPCQAIVTFNGKAFDLPILHTRYITHGWRPPMNGAAHIDLLHLARRLWRDRLPSRTLMNLEYQILGAMRSEEDVPGWMIPSLYFDYLRSGDARPLKSVVYHNAMDVISLAALFNHTASILADPLNGGVEHGEDLVALGRLFESLGDLDKAIHLYLTALDRGLPRETLLDAIQRLALIHKRRDNYTDAVALWEQAAQHEHLYAHVELAKFYEHRLRDYHEAMHWTLTALEIANSGAFSPYERRQWLGDLQHRLERLKRKLSDH